MRRNHFISDWRKGLRSNDYWLFTVLDGSQDQPYTLNWSRHRKAFYDSLTVQNINDIASALLQDNLAIAVEIIPMAVVQDDPVGGADSGEPTGTDNSNRSLRSGTPEPFRSLISKHIYST